jgi:ribulose-5-phosphate 4-epimerase/fuculose-1-phosphate aldolase
MKYRAGPGSSAPRGSRPIRRKTITQELDDLVAAYRILAAHGVIDAYGHVSLRSPRNPERYYLARSVAPEWVNEEDLIQYDLDSHPIDDNGRESVLERFIHGEIYRARPEVMCVVHNHSPSVVPFSVTGVPLRALFHMASFVGEGLPNFEIRDVRKGTDLLIRDATLGKALADTLAGKPAALMRGHGSVVVGENLPRAVGRSVYLEQSARMQMQALALAGPAGPITWLDDAEMQSSIARQDYARAWPLWRAKALKR